MKTVTLKWNGEEYRASLRVLSAALRSELVELEKSHRRRVLEQVQQDPELALLLDPELLANLQQEAYASQVAQRLLEAAARVLEPGFTLEVVRRCIDAERLPDRWRELVEQEVSSDFWQQQPLEEMERVRDFFIGAGSSKMSESPR